MDQTVELYCGSEKPFSKIAEALGYATFTVDLNPAYQPTLVGEVNEAHAREIPAGPLLVWAAPPYSEIFRSAESWESDGSFHPRTADAEAAIAKIRNTISLLTRIQPKWWFIEHPRSLLREMPLFRGFNRGYPTRNRQTIKHLQYGGKNHRDTDIWTNAFWWLPNTSDQENFDAKQGETVGRVPAFIYSQIFEQLDSYNSRTS